SDSVPAPPSPRSSPGQAVAEVGADGVVGEHLGSLAGAILTHAGERSDPAETAAIAHRTFVALAYEDPRLAWLIVHLDRADALLERASVPHLGPALERGLRTGRFHGVDVDVTISFLVGATVAVMRGILTGRLGPGADERSAR